MKFKEQKIVEAVGFAARANIASDLDSFLEAIAAEPTVVSLQNILRDEPASINYLVRVMRHLRELDFDTTYENPKDTAMATYGWIVASVYPVLEGLVSDLMRTLRNSWWSNRLAERLQSKHQEVVVSRAKSIEKIVEYLNEDNVEKIRITGTHVIFSHPWPATNLLERGHAPSTELIDQSSEQEVYRATIQREFQTNLGASTEMDEFTILNGQFSTTSSLPLNVIISRSEKGARWHFSSESTVDRQIFSADKLLQVAK